MKEAITITLYFISIVILSDLGLTYIIFEFIKWKLLFEDFDIEIKENEIL